LSDIYIVREFPAISRCLNYASDSDNVSLYTLPSSIVIQLALDLLCLWDQTPETYSVILTSAMITFFASKLTAECRFSVRL